MRGSIRLASSASTIRTLWPCSSTSHLRFRFAHPVGLRASSISSSVKASQSCERSRKSVWRSGLRRKQIGELAVQTHALRRDIEVRAVHPFLVEGAERGVREAGGVGRYPVALHYRAGNAAAGEKVGGRCPDDAAADNHDVGRAIGHGVRALRGLRIRIRQCTAGGAAIVVRRHGLGKTVVVPATGHVSRDPVWAGAPCPSASRAVLPVIHCPSLRSEGRLSPRGTPDESNRHLHLCRAAWEVLRSRKEEPRMSGIGRSSSQGGALCKSPTSISSLT